MKRGIIFANGRMEDTPALVETIRPADLVIAANGGSYHCRALGITPSVIIGDFDSLSPEDIVSYQQAGVEIIQYPSQKNETDLELALQLALKRGVSEVLIIGALGARWDMTIANILLIAHPMFSGIKIRLLDGTQEFILLRGKERADLHGRRAARKAQNHRDDLSDKRHRVGAKLPRRHHGPREAPADAGRGDQERAL